MEAKFSVKYRLAPEDITRTDGKPFDLRRDAIDHRDWFFGHAHGVVSCWIENAKGLRSGALLCRRNP
jgi:hypothetical protein